MQIFIVWIKKIEQFSMFYETIDNNDYDENIIFYSLNITLFLKTHL